MGSFDRLKSNIILSGDRTSIKLGPVDLEVFLDGEIFQEEIALEKLKHFSPMRITNPIKRQIQPKDDCWFVFRYTCKAWVWMREVKLYESFKVIWLHHVWNGQQKAAIRRTEYAPSCKCNRDGRTSWVGCTWIQFSVQKVTIKTFRLKFYGQLCQVFIRKLSRTLDKDEDSRPDSTVILSVSSRIVLNFKDSHWRF